MDDGYLSCETKIQLYVFNKKLSPLSEEKKRVKIALLTSEEQNTVVLAVVKSYLSIYVYTLNHIISITVSQEHYLIYFINFLKQKQVWSVETYRSDG